MIPYKIDEIKSILDVQRKYPKLYDSRLLGKSVVKKFIREELQELVDDELDRCLWAEEEAKPIPTLEYLFMDTARAKALYHYLWAFEHNIDIMVKWGWKSGDIGVLMKRMKSAGYDFFSTEEDTAGQYIESLEGYGFKKVETKNGDKFYLYNPKGYGEDKTTRQNDDEE
jgi:hypothetical protein